MSWVAYSRFRLSVICLGCVLCVSLSLQWLGYLLQGPCCLLCLWVIYYVLNVYFTSVVCCHVQPYASMDLCVCSLVYVWLPGIMSTVGLLSGFIILLTSLLCLYFFPTLLSMMILLWFITIHHMFWLLTAKCSWCLTSCHDYLPQVCVHCLSIWVWHCVSGLLILCQVPQFLIS